MNLPARKHKTYPEIVSLKVSPKTLMANLSDGRQVSVPLAWFPRLAEASKKSLHQFEISPAGYGIHWPDIDEDISIKVFLD